MPNNACSYNSLEAVFLLLDFLCARMSPKGEPKAKKWLTSKQKLDSSPPPTLIDVLEEWSLPREDMEGSRWLRLSLSERL